LLDRGVGLTDWHRRLLRVFRLIHRRPRVAPSAISTEPAIPLPREKHLAGFGPTRARRSSRALGEPTSGPPDALVIERLLRAGRHDKAAEHFCLRFAQRCFPLDYPWTGGRDGRLLVEVTGGIQHEGYGDSWEEIGDLWSLRPVFLLSWTLMEDPYGPLRDEFIQDETRGDEQDSGDRLCDVAREGVAQFADLTIDELFAGVPPDGFPTDHLRERLCGTVWEPLLWAAPWLWRVSGNPILDRDGDDYPEPEPWSESVVFHLSAAFREALRIMRAIDAFDTWLIQAPAERSRGAVQAALGQPSNRISTLLDLPIADRRAERCQRVAMPH
jgi:hypothetical protein